MRKVVDYTVILCACKDKECRIRCKTVYTPDFCTKCCKECVFYMEEVK